MNAALPTTDMRPGLNGAKLDAKSNLFVSDILHQYTVDIVRDLVSQGHALKVAKISNLPGYHPSGLDQLLAEFSPRVVFAEDFHFPERFNEICDADVSVLSLEFFEKVSYYEKMFLLTSDRLAFWPISQLDRCRLFYRFVAHFYKIVREESINAVLFDSFPHGLTEIALFGLAKALDLKVAYMDWPGFSADYATVETEIHPRRQYGELGKSLEAKGDAARQEVHRTFKAHLSAQPVWTAYTAPNRAKLLFRTIAGLALRSPLQPYRNSSAFFLNSGSRARIGYIWPLIKYFVRTRRLEKHYDRHARHGPLEENSIVFFLHMQPESSTLPQGGIFTDQLLAFDMILQALPPGKKLYVKEHPLMFAKFAEDVHDRSADFYSHMLRDPRVVFVHRFVDSGALLQHASVVISINGTISWEAVRTGKPSVIFGWAWFAGCDSCYVVDSVDSLRSAFADALTKTPDDVRADVDRFVAAFSNRLVHGVPTHFALPYMGKDVEYDRSVRQIAAALGRSLEVDQAARAGR